jgi:tetratricopeptide (TPR) repeat protein
VNDGVYNDFRSLGGAGLIICGALARFWWMRGHVAEGRDWCKKALQAQGAEERTAERARALSGAGGLALAHSDFPAARAYHEESLAIRREIGNRRGIAGSLGSLGVVARIQGDYASARAYQEESLAIRRELGDRQGVSSALNNLGNALRNLGETATARACHLESLAIKRDLQDWAGIAQSLGNLGNLAADLGDIDAARAYQEESVAIMRKIGFRRGLAESLNDLGLLAAIRNDCETARRCHEESLAICREIGDRHGLANTLEAFAAAIATSSVSGSSQHNPAAEMQKAARLCGSASALRETIGAPLAPQQREDLECRIAPARQALGKALWDSLSAEGRAMPIEQAILHALEAKR